MSARRWSLSGRLTRLFVLSTSVLVLAIAFSSSLLLRGSVNKELDALLERRIKEVRLQAQKDQGDLQPILAALDRAEHNRTNKVGWRQWRTNVQVVVGEYGHTNLLPASGDGQMPEMRLTERLEGNLIRRAEVLHGVYAIEAVLDASPQIGLLHRYQWFAGLALLTSAGLGLVLGTVLLGRVSTALRRVAESARGVRHPEASAVLEIAEAPDEIRDVVEALRELMENVRREMDQSRVFYASVAHELRSPIQNLVGETEVALLTGRDVEGYRSVLESNLEELRELADAIDNLVTICAGPTTQDTSVEEFDLAEEAAIRLQRERQHAQRHGVDFRFDARGDTRLSGDREGLLRALRNLAANAIEWSSRGDHVDVELDGANGQVIVTVDDAGPGVPEELRGEIFSPFVRGAAASGRRVGYGLGLAIVRSAVDGQGGQIEVGQSPQGGARFRLTLPKSRPPEGRHPAS